MRIFGEQSFHQVKIAKPTKRASTHLTDEIWYLGGSVEVKLVMLGPDGKDKKQAAERNFAQCPPIIILYPKKFSHQDDLNDQNWRYAPGIHPLTMATK
ncbi:hypothetical protein CBER1_11590 [Cercospora berteroae]|uniref:Uncharacterized protein n=1 Tax=Cercospora berteroae TaxID=357750 RepID=A0A2S6CM77_9PEZI|nr:hypothetical protein CBER1_11590 [Cercospora berteroae]